MKESLRKKDTLKKRLPGKGKKILLAEDNEVNQQLMVIMLKRFGFTVEVASDGKEVLEWLRKEKDFDCILMDLKMPELDGYSATRLLRSELKSRVPVIALSGHVTAEEKQQCLQVGMDDYISKPFDPGLLLEKILDLQQAGHVKPVRGGTAKQKRAKGPINRTHLQEITSGNVGQQQQLVALFIRHTPLMLEELEEHFACGRYPEVRKLAHKIRSGASVILGRSFSGLLEEIEYCESGKETNMKKPIAEFTRVCREALKELKAMAW